MRNLVILPCVRLLPESFLIGSFLLYGAAEAGLGQWTRVLPGNFRHFIYVMKLLRYETFTLWNSYVMKLLRYETLTIWNSYVMKLLH